MTRAVVFAYHDVGVRCLSVLVGHGVEVPLVVTHLDDPGENVWFESVAQRCDDFGIPWIAPDDPNTPELLERVRALAPDFLFSFYYRRMLGAPLLDVAPRGALNMHGSLLPRYRGRAPVNWAVLHGERETGASLHYMTPKPDQGDVVARQRVPIMPDDTALDVFRKVTCAAELALDGVLPALLAGSAARTPQRLAEGSYFGGRKPEDGRIDWGAAGRRIHDLVRAVAPPYPGAFADLPAGRLQVLRSHVETIQKPRHARPTLRIDGERLYVDCADGQVLRLISIALDGEVMGATEFARRQALPLALA